ncbi:MAG: hypothetical protein AAGC74_06050 [Verrucomicrobiota bacterium]
MSEEEPKKGIPKKRRVKGARRSNQSSSRKTLYLKRQELLREMVEGDKEVSLSDQIARIDPKRATPEEEKWGDKTRMKKGSNWLLWAVVGMAVPVLVVGFLILSRGANSQSGAEEASALNLDFDLMGDEETVKPEDWFIEHSVEVFKGSLAILEDFEKGDVGSEELRGVFRSEGQYERFVEAQESGAWAGFSLDDPSAMKTDYGSSGEAGFMVIRLERKDFRDGRAYFVHQDDEVRFDFDATEAYSEVPVPELTGRKLEEPVLVRAWIGKEPHFDARSDETVFSWYQVLDPGLAEFVWAYARRGSEIDERLREELNYGRLIEERKREFRGTVRLSNATGFREDEFEIVELLATEWVLSVQED